MTVAREDLFPAQLGARSWPAHAVAQAHHRWGGPAARCAADRVAFGEDLGLAAQHQSEGARQGGDVKRFVVLIQNENFAVHMSAIVAGDLRLSHRRLAHGGWGGMRE